MADRNTNIPGNQIQNDSVKQDELDITNVPTDGQLLQVNMPAGDFTAIDPSAVGGGSTFRQTFVTGDLTADKITITHSLNTLHPVVAVYDNSDNIILPTEITYKTVDTIELDFTGMTPLTGTYKVRVIGSGGSIGDKIQDADNDTKIEVEQSTDEDKIRMTTAGTQRALLDANGLKLQSGADVNEFSTDGTLAGDSDDAIPTEKAVKTYVDVNAGSLADVARNEINIVLNAFRIAVNGSLTQFNMVDGIVDEYEDESGISLSNTKLLLNFNGTDAETSTEDASASAHSITFNGTAQLDTAQQKFGTASLLLDGDSDYLSIPDSTDFDIAGSNSDNWTIDFWVKHTDHAGTEAYVTQYEDSNNLWEIRHQNGSGIRFDVTSGGVTIIDTGWSGEITDNNWHHVTLIKVADEYAIYLDGTQVNYVQDSSIDTFSAILQIGASNGASLFDGHIDDFRIIQSNIFNGAPNVGLTDTITIPTAEVEIESNTSLNQSYDSVNDLYSPSGDSLDTSPFSHMLMEDNTDEGTGANAVSNIGTPTYTSGHLNNALTLDGSTDALNVDALEADIDTDTTGSFAIWFYSGALDATRKIVSLGNSVADGTGWGIGVRSSNELEVIYLGNPGTIYWKHLSSISTNTWYHVTVVQDGVSPKIYLDGVDVTTLTVTVDTTKWFADDATFDRGRIGCWHNGSDISFFDGQIDDFRYYQNTVLTQAEIDLLYNSGTGTEDDQPVGDPSNMTLISEDFTAEAQADTARIVLFEEDIDAVTINTDLLAYASRDAGTTYSQITLINEGEYESGKNILSASVDISGQPSGTTMKYKLVTANNKDLKIHGSGLSWD